jgi:Ni,Fe-hydrogenase III small subunit
MELRALASAPYDLGGAGFGLANTPAGADMLLVSGPLTRMMAPVLQAAWEAMPDPKGIICMGDCALDGGVFGENYATLGGLERRVTIDLRLPGCPPTPTDVLAGLASLLRGDVQDDLPPA